MSFSSMIEQVRSNLYDNSYAGRPKMQRLATSVADTASDTTIQVDTFADVSVGDIIEFVDATDEQCLVWSLSTPNIVIVRAVNGTTKAAHADDTFIRLNPKWTTKQISDALNEAVADMSAQQLFKVGAKNITLVEGKATYSYATDAHPGVGALAAFYQDSASDKYTSVPFLETYEPASGAWIRFLDWGGKAVGDVIEVLYAQALDSDALSDELEAAAVAYATGKLMAASEGSRIHDPGRHTDRTVQPGQGIRDGSFWLATYQRAVWRYRAALNDSIRNLPGARLRRTKRFRRG